MRRTSLACGSSPRVRGTQRRHRDELVIARFIPACAGNAKGDSLTRARSSVHPRVCGERSILVLGYSRRSGSSPRVRGTPVEGLSGALCARFIPACAGNARHRHWNRLSYTVHPRVCGERSHAQPQPSRAAGSSPRVRGTRAPGSGPLGAWRFIPACAGNASQTSPAPPRRAVHPRVCGERMVLTGRRLHPGGSSPRVRGTPNSPGIFSRSPRFIPACAGNALADPLAGRPRPVHPRVCGERAPWCARSTRSAGSSPRVRGTLAIVFIEIRY